MSKLKFSIYFVLTVLALAACQSPQPAYECTDAIGCVEIGPGEPIKIGVLQSLDTSKTPGGVVQVRSIELAVEHHDGNILDHPIELIIEDSQCSTEGGTIAALTIVADPQIIGALGTTCSSAAATASQIISEAGLVMISGLNTAPSLTKLQGLPGENWQPGYFRTLYNGSQIAQTAATFVTQELGGTSAAMINSGDIYSSDLTKEFEQVFTELGGNLVFSGVVSQDDTNMEPVLAAVVASGAEALYLPVFIPQASLLVNQAAKMAEFDEITLLGGEVLGSPAFIDAVGSNGIGMYITGMETPSGADYAQLELAYETRFGEPPNHHGFPFAYDAANLLIAAIEAVAVPLSDGTIIIGRDALRKQLYATTGFEGLTGRLSCTQFGDCSAVRFVVFHFENPSTGLDGLLSNVVFTYEPPKDNK